MWMLMTRGLSQRLMRRLQTRCIRISCIYGLMRESRSVDSKIGGVWLYSRT